MQIFIQLMNIFFCKRFSKLPVTVIKLNKWHFINNPKSKSIPNESSTLFFIRTYIFHSQLCATINRLNIYTEKPDPFVLPTYFSTIILSPSASGIAATWLYFDNIILPQLTISISWLSPCYYIITVQKLEQFITLRIKVYLIKSKVTDHIKRNRGRNDTLTQS